MALGAHIVGRVARLHPLLALIAMFGVIVVAETAGIVVAGFVEPDVFPPASMAYIAVTTAISGVFYMGYPVAIAIHVLRTVGPVTQVKPARLAAAALLMLAAHVTAHIMGIGPWPDGPGFVILGSMAWLAGFASPLYIMGTAARGLVYAEEGHAVAFNRAIGTFFMFAFLPLGIYFLQRRLRRLPTGEIPPLMAQGNE